VLFDDPDESFIYLDIARIALAASFTRRQRWERWLYHGLHSLDFPFWYDNRPVWAAGVIFLCLGGAILCAIGIVIGFNRLKQMLRASL
jgi:hypothetical protein